ncbi:MAG TPA: hypothetical protein VGB75_09815 [Jatrophihabitans sp.]|uniref:hypothetical protein n=1 Tax=Jatrophihabitans sp. TaxID=1932789 RepID=UPI002EEB8C15
MFDEADPAAWLVVGSHDLRSSIRRPAEWRVTLLRCPVAALAPTTDGAQSYTLNLADWPPTDAVVLDSGGTVIDRLEASLEAILNQDHNMPIGLLRPAAPLTSSVVLYPQVDIYHGHARFLRLPGEPSPRSAALTDLLAGIDEHFLKITNYLCFRVNLKPDVELEHKFTLTGHPDVYALARDTLRLVESDGLPGFHVEFREEIQGWDFLNHVYAIEEPAEEAGYVSFIPTTDGRHTVKRKIYTEDTDERVEIRDRGVKVGPDLEAYVRDVMGLTPAWNASFRRARYDITVEAHDSGNVIGIAYDQCVVIDESGGRVAGAAELTQCEMEYLYSQSLTGATFESVRQDLSHLRGLMDSYFDERGIENYQRHESKLTFLRNQHAALR